jgi:hypothetical protein
MKVAIRRVSLASLGKFGCLLGTVAALLPSLLCGLLAAGLANAVRRWLEGWQEVTISLLGQELARFDLVHLLGLDQVMQLLKTLASVSGPVLVLGIVVLALLSGILLALIIALVGIVYNLLASATGGLVVEMSTVSTKEAAE